MKWKTMVVVVASMGCLSVMPAFAATGATTTYTATIADPAAASVSSSSENAGTVTYSSSSDMLLQDEGITVTNSGGTAGNVYAQLGTSPTGLTEEASGTLAADDFEAYAATGALPSGETLGNVAVNTSASASPVELPEATSTSTETYDSLTPSASTAITIEFYFGAGTTAGTYSIPVVYTVQ